MNGLSGQAYPSTLSCASITAVRSDGYVESHTPRYQTQWFAVAEYIRSAEGKRSSWINAHYPALMQKEIRVLKGDEWIRDMIFPARLFLKSIGVSSVRYADLPSSREPLLLNKLEQYQVRDFITTGSRD